ncbi:hypothetical protein MML48_9g00011193 [Holotrichia oblita]|uniref:Uncharacterized protein n=1 Tax=Holotrichia oblita TaxID=644536 RepID=A0ACB9SS14_HOLOL|nr:hypothetical protein MML48_9g00011193 [Holotrichia oblita]
MVVVARNEPLICLYGEMSLRQHDSVANAVLYRMRTLARLLIALRELTNGEVRALFDGLRPAMFSALTSATRLISGYDDRRNNFESPSLARRVGVDLRSICDIALKLISEGIEVPKIVYDDKTVRKMEIKKLRTLIERDWRNSLGLPPGRNCSLKISNSTVTLPSSDDIKLFDGHFLRRRCEGAYENLKKNRLPQHYQVLTESVLAAVVMFNRKAIGDIETLKIDVYNRDLNESNRESHLVNSPYETHRILYKKLKTVFTDGYGFESTNLPIFFPAQIQQYVTYLLNVRDEMDVGVSKTNPYLFADNGIAYLSATKVISKLARDHGIRYRQLLTCTKSRRYIATTLQLINMDMEDLERIRNVVGYCPKRQDSQYSPSPLDVHEALKITKLLLQFEKQKRNDTEGKMEYVNATNDGNLYNNALLNWKCEFQQQNTVEISSNNHDIPLSRKKLNKQVCQIIYEHQFSFSLESTTVAMKKFIVGRVKWTKEEKKIVKDYFSWHIQHKITPKKKECEELLQLYGDELINKDWVRVKTLVYNTFRNKDIDNN